MNDAADAASRFLGALRFGDEKALWELFSDRARRRIIDVGEEQSLPAAMAGRIRSETASADEMTSFLADVVDGVRRDLEWSNIARLRTEVVTETAVDARVALVEPLAITLPGSPAGLPAAWLNMTREGDSWLIDHIDLPSR